MIKFRFYSHNTKQNTLRRTTTTNDDTTTHADARRTFDCAGRGTPTPGLGTGWGWGLCAVAAQRT